MKTAIGEVRFDEAGLVPAVVQDARTREVLTLAYMNAESLKRTLEDGETWFWSRSRSELWHKGATSGNTQRVVEVRLDCDGDAIVALVEPAGPACHTGARSCFQSETENESDDIADESVATVKDAHQSSDVRDLGSLLTELYQLIKMRRREMPDGSYTTYLFREGLDKILKKVGEESAEIIIAAKNENAHALTSEISDLLYHVMVLMVERGISLEQVGVELARRGGKGSE
ncbi:MAG: bifunctional phosphoribosyl-AMP cyclohydrolase/phosphoribosyl-ATP diphosphatase HisIE [Pyrinomonadaceae bacterium]|nr:bifunctional phosphoribosyl-AMP cyclohydrolase/phosphoribosyl-ATP diphosphatase HisIE [Pyrinomonadaceae bacterium]